VTSTEQFISSLANALAWPLAVVVLAIVFRHQLAQLLASIRKLRFPGGEAEFGEQLGKARAEVPIAVPGPAPGHAPSLSAELDGVLRRSPAKAVADAFERVEERLRTRITERNPEAHGGLKGAGLVGFAYGLGVISPKTKQALEDLARLRDIAEKSPEGATPELARTYIALVEDVLYSIDHDRPDDEQDVGPQALNTPT
jgi:hypothetical protein